ncbi:GNAT family acetyltransferase [Sphingomonas naphthae]|uniref:GNAT family acetyltransferase n=1 Tax=Sphingomonas naphthae TaxID=1813468 RepID=A0ABY7TM21_9SPHN|nr:GNAT family acetyltransferase [Sphingomonas naphthae]WCT74048.1 GNAT family acetyltransferase [Sphingomonas naphthae]
MTAAGIPIGRLDPAETEAAVALWQAAGLTRPWNDPRADIAAALACPTATILAAREDGGGTGDRLVATVMAGFDGHRGWLYYLAVADDRRGQGLGRAMVAAAEAWLAAEGAPKVQLMIRADNAAARGFYGRLGYEQSDVMVVGKRLDR